MWRPRCWAGGRLRAASRGVVIHVGDIAVFVLAAVVVSTWVVVAAIESNTAQNMHEQNATLDRRASTPQRGQGMERGVDAMASDMSVILNMQNCTLGVSAAFRSTRFVGSLTGKYTSCQPNRTLAETSIHFHDADFYARPSFLLRDGLISFTFPDVLVKSRVKCLILSIDVLCAYKWNAEYICSEVRTPCIGSPIELSRSEALKCVAPRSHMFMLGDGAWVADQDHLPTSDAKALLGFTSEFHHTWLTNDGPLMLKKPLLYGRRLKALLATSNLCLVGDSVMMGMFRQVIQFAESTNLMDVKKDSDLFGGNVNMARNVMSRRSGFGRHGNVSFLGIHDPNYGGLANLRQVSSGYLSQFKDMITTCAVVVINSGLHDLGAIQGTSNATEAALMEVLGRYQMNLRWLVNYTKEWAAPTTQLVWRQTTCTRDYVPGRIAQTSKFDLPAHVDALNKAAFKIMHAAGIRVFDTGKPTCAAVTQEDWWSDLGHFHYASGNYTGGMNRVLTQALLQRHLLDEVEAPVTA